MQVVFNCVNIVLASPTKEKGLAVTYTSFGKSKFCPECQKVKTVETGTGRGGQTVHRCIKSTCSCEFVIEADGSSVPWLELNLVSDGDNSGIRYINVVLKHHFFVKIKRRNTFFLIIKLVTCINMPKKREGFVQNVSL